MRKLKGTIGLILAILMIWTSLPVFAAQKKSPPKLKLQLITPPKQEYKVGEKIYIKAKTPNYKGRVEYRIIITNETKKTNKELWAKVPGYYYKQVRPAGNKDFSIGWTLAEPGSYKLTLFVRRVGAKVSYDDYVKTKTFIVKAKTPEVKGLVLEKQGQIYGPESITNMENIEKDIYIKADNITLRNLMIKGTIFIDPGKDGKALLENTTATNIKLLSGGEKSIQLVNTHTKNLEILTSKGARVELTEGSKMENTTINSSAILDLKEGSFGKILIPKEKREMHEIKFLGKIKDMITVESEALIETGENSQIEQIEISPENKNASILLQGNFNTVYIQKESSIVMEGTIKNLEIKAKATVVTTDKTTIETLNRNGNEVKLIGNGKVIKDEANSGSTSGGTGGNPGGTIGGGVIIPPSPAPDIEYAGVLLSNGTTLAAVKIGNTNEYLVDLTGIDGHIGVKTTFATTKECKLTLNGYSFNLKAHEKRSFGPADFGEIDNNPPGVSLLNFRENFADSKGCVSQKITLTDSSNQSVTIMFIMKV